MVYKKNLGFYVVLTHKFVPKKDTQNKEVEVMEECEFVDRIKDRMLQKSTVIMDVENKVLLKNRAKHKGATYEDFQNHCRNTYKEKFETFEKYVAEKTGQPTTNNAQEEPTQNGVVTVTGDLPEVVQNGETNNQQAG